MLDGALFRLIKFDTVFCWASHYTVTPALDEIC
jgi:hypothetical protein